MTQRAVPAGTLIPGRSNHAGLVKGLRPDEEQPLVLQVRGLGGRLITRSRKKKHITETETRITTAPYREAGVQDVNTRLEQRGKQRMTHKPPMKLLSPKACVKIGQWNVSTLFEIVCIIREVLWKLLRHYGMPDKMVTIIRVLYEGFSAQVVHNGQKTQPLNMRTGVKQGSCYLPCCCWSPWIR